MFKIILNWAFKRVFGLRDFPLFITMMKIKFSKSNKSIESEHWGTIRVENDIQIGRWVEPMRAGTESCPNWYSTRLIYGQERTMYGLKNSEYWVGIRNTFLAPILPIPICSEEVVFKIGSNDGIFYDCKKKYGDAYSLINHKKEYTHKIINKANVEFDKCDVTYKNDPIWSSYDK